MWRDGLAGLVIGGLVGAACWATWPTSFPLALTLAYSSGAGGLLGLAYGKRVADWVGDIVASLF